jgi:Xaa-Pro aminopeptidase
MGLTVEGCRQRQQRVLQRMQDQNIDRLVVTRPEHVQYLSGFHTHHLMASIASLDSAGKLTLIAPNREPEGVAADEIMTYQAQWHSTLRPEQQAAAAEQLELALRGVSLTRMAVDGAFTGIHALTAIGLDSVAAAIDFEPDLWRLRRRKDSDELELMQKAIDCTEAMYLRAREIVEPGICEIDLFNELQAVAVSKAGEPLAALLGNDFQCNSRGGPPRDNRAQAGQLYILDLGPCYRGYYADNCRTISVDRQPTDLQMQAWNLIQEVFALIEREVRPGVRAKQIFESVQQLLDGFPDGTFPHHLGHGVGLYPHEAPHLNPFWDDVFEQGDVFTVEPGLYGEELAFGMRLENNYRVTDNGVHLLTPFNLELA